MSCTVQGPKTCCCQPAHMVRCGHDGAWCDLGGTAARMPAATLRGSCPHRKPLPASTPSMPHAGSISARGGAATPLSRFLSETALQEKQRMLQLDRDAAVAALAQQQATQPAAPIPHPAPAAGQQAPVRGSGARKWACGCFGL